MFLVAQQDMTVEQPRTEDLYTVGTIVQRAADPPHARGQRAGDGGGHLPGAACRDLTQSGALFCMAEVEAIPEDEGRARPRPRPRP